ncbi:MAG: ATP-binding protein [Desulfatitalea sp.]
MIENQLDTKDIKLLAPSDPQVEDFDFAKDRVLHHLSHALKTPLAVLIASLKLLAKHLNRLPDSAWQTVYQRAQRNLERLLSIEYETEDILGQREKGFAEAELSGNGKTPGTHQPKDFKNDFFHHVNIEFLVHELKDPVGIVESGVRMLMEKPEPGLSWTPTQQRTLQRVLRNVHKTREMLNELLEVGRAQNVCFHCRPFQPLEALKKIVVEVVELNDPELFEEMKAAPKETDRLAFLARKGIRLDVAPAAEALTVEQDEVKFCQVAGNLIKNGFYYRRRHLLIHLACQQDHFSVSVRDDGPGIASIHQEEIFQRYKQVAPCVGMARTGHGLGLAMARILARTMGGDIGVESELGQGALFHLHLPVASAH